MDTGQTDTILVEQLIESNERAFTVLFNRYQRFMRAEAFFLTQNHEEAEDITQEVFADLWKRRHQLDRQIAIRAYLHRAVRNQVYKKYRKLEYEQRYIQFTRYTQEEASLTQSPITQLEKKEQVMLIQQAIQFIPAYAQHTFKKVYQENADCKTLAKEMNVGLQTIYNQVSVAVKSLRVRLKIKE